MKNRLNLIRLIDTLFQIRMSQMYVHIEGCEEYIISSYNISKERVIHCDICDLRVQNLSVEIHMKEHYSDITDTYISDDEMEINDESDDDNTVSVEEDELHKIMNYEYVKKCEDGIEEKDCFIWCIPSEVLLHICKYLNLYDVVKLDSALGDDHISKTGIKLDLQNKFLKSKLDIEMDVHEINKVIQNFVCFVLPVVKGNQYYLIRTPEIYIKYMDNEPRAFPITNDLTQIYFEYKAFYLKLLRFLTLQENAVKLIDKWISSDVV